MALVLDRRSDQSIIIEVAGPDGQSRRIEVAWNPSTTLSRVKFVIKAPPDVRIWRKEVEP